jgi:Family of unknown function (DUF5995)
VNGLIAKVEKKMKAWMMTALSKELDLSFNPVDDIVAVWNVKKARDAAWVGAEAIWSLRRCRRCAATTKRWTTGRWASPGAPCSLLLGWRGNCGEIFSGASRARTGDLRLAKAALFQLSYGPSPEV